MRNAALLAPTSLVEVERRFITRKTHRHAVAAPTPLAGVERRFGREVRVGPVDVAVRMPIETCDRMANLCSTSTSEVGAGNLFSPLTLVMNPRSTPTSGVGALP